MTAQLPPHLVRLFAPRPPLPYLPPLDKDPGQHVRPQISGVAAYLERCHGHDVDYEPRETIQERKAKRVKKLNLSI
jgi:U1 small nuclear ribonucleoprotein